MVQKVIVEKISAGAPPPRKPRPSGKKGKGAPPQKKKQSTNKQNQPRKRKNKNKKFLKGKPNVVNIRMRELPTSDVPYGVPLVGASGSRSVNRSMGRRVLHQSQLASEIETFSADRKLTTNVAAVLSQYMLPYTSPLVRVKTASTGSNLQATALTRNFVNYKYDMKALVDVVNSDTGRIALPGYGTGYNGSGIPLFGNLGVYFPILHYYDPYVLGSLPIPNVQVDAGYVSTYYFGPLVNSATTFTAGALPYSTLNLDPTTSGFRLKSSALGASTFQLSPVRLLGASTPDPPAQGEHPIVDCQGLRWFWLDSMLVEVSASRVEVSIRSPGNSIPPTCVSAMLFVLGEASPTDEEDITQQVFPAAGVNIFSTVVLKPATSGWFRIGLRNETTPINTSVLDVSVKIVYTTSVVTKFILNDQLSLTNDTTGDSFVGKVQLNGSSLLISNTTQEMGIGGYVFAAQVTDTSNPVLYQARPDDTIMANPIVRYQGNWKDGVYGYLKPQKAAMLRDFSTTVFRPFEDLSFEHGYTGLIEPEAADGCYAASSYILAPTLSPDQTLYTVSAQLTFCVALEYTTSSQLAQLAHPSIMPNEVEDALAALADIDCPFSTNPLHLKEMWSKLKSATSRVVSESLPFAKKAAISLLPSLGPVGAAASLGLEML